MSTDDRIQLLARVARSSSSPGGVIVDAAKPVSILSLAAASYGARPSADSTSPTGFDPAAVALFEAIVEGAFLVATADGVFDAAERRMFERVVVTACGGSVRQEQIAALVGDLEDQLKEDQLDRRVRAVSEMVQKKEHAREVLRIAALIGLASGDVTDVERDVLARLSKAFGLDKSDVALAIEDVRKALDEG